MEKKTVLNELKIKNDYPHWLGDLKQSKNGSKFYTKKGAVSLLIDTPNNGLGNYNVHINLDVENIDIYRVKKEINFPGRERIYLGGIGLMPDDRLNSWFFLKNETNDGYKVNNIFLDLNNFYYPLSYGLLFDYSWFLEQMQKENKFLLGLREPFATIVIMSFFMKKEKWIYEVLVPKINSKGFGENTESIFYDYNSCNNYEVEIIESVRKWFMNNDS